MTSHPEHDDTIDELASRLLDGDVAIDEVDDALRSVVLARRDEFAAVRDRLRVETPLTAVAPLSPLVPSRSRSVRYTVLGLAAAAMVGLVGVAITTRSTDPADTAGFSAAPLDTDTLDTDTLDTATQELAEAPMTTEAPMTAAGDAAMSTRIGERCPDPVGRPVIFVGTYESRPVEVHFSELDGLVVYDTTDCGVVLGIVP